MEKLFSFRQRNNLKNKKIEVSFNVRLRTAVIRVLKEYSSYAGWDNSDNWSFERAEEMLMTFYGVNNLSAFDNNKQKVSASFEGMMLSGYPSEFLDGIEVWFKYVELNKLAYAEKELNDIFTIHDSRWRILNGRALLIDSKYIHEEIITKTLELMGQDRAIGAQQEFQEAINFLQTKDYKRAITEAHKSVESVMKTALETEEHFTFGKLLSELIKADIIPIYYEEFLIHFEKITLACSKERNKPGTGHGQGSLQVEVPRSLAEFALNLAGTLNLFILQRWIEKSPQKADVSDTEANEISFSEEDIPF